jgi:hypothetical protein
MWDRIYEGGWRVCGKREKNDGQIAGSPRGVALECGCHCHRRPMMWMRWVEMIRIGVREADVRGEERESEHLRETRREEIKKRMRKEKR